MPPGGPQGHGPDGADGGNRTRNPRLTNPRPRVRWRPPMRHPRSSGAHHPISRSSVSAPIAAGVAASRAGVRGPHLHSEAAGLDWLVDPGEHEFR
jgi:hypothetical protein